MRVGHKTDYFSSRPLWLAPPTHGMTAKHYFSFQYAIPQFKLKQSHDLTNVFRDKLGMINLFDPGLINLRSFLTEDVEKPSSVGGVFHHVSLNVSLLLHCILSHKTDSVISGEEGHARRIESFRSTTTRTHRKTGRSQICRIRGQSPILLRGV